MSGDGAHGVTRPTSRVGYDWVGTFLSRTGAGVDKAAGLRRSPKRFATVPKASRLVEVGCTGAARTE